MNKYTKEEKDEKDDSEDDGFIKERRKRRIKNKRKFKNRMNPRPKKIKGFGKAKPRQRNWSNFIDEDDEE